MRIARDYPGLRETDYSFELDGDLVSHDGIYIDLGDRWLIVNGHLSSDGYIVSRGSIKATQSIYSGRDIVCSGLESGGSISARLGIVAGRGVKATSSIETYFALQAGEGIESGSYIHAQYIRAGSEIKAGEDIKSGSSIKSGSNIVSGGDILAGANIEAGLSISSGGEVISGRSIRSVGDIKSALSIEARFGIESGGSITAGLGVKAGLNIICRRVLSAKYPVFAGICTWMGQDLANSRVICERFEAPLGYGIVREQLQREANKKNSGSGRK